MNPFLKQVLCLRNDMVLQQAVTVMRLATSKSLSLCCAGSTTLSSRRHYRSMPTHGIGRYKYLLPKEQPKKKKEKIQMKEIKPGTETEYGVLNVRVIGHDMTLTEHYAQYIHKLCNRLRIQVEESYALPGKTTEVMLLQEQGTKMSAEGVLKTHERVVQISGLSSTLAPIFVEVLQMNQPEGVDFSIKQHTELDFQNRFKARLELERLVVQMS
ncbi:39S ribosomal protein L48, mitochondrial [Latimeria chalumnae]|uniref:39S ribosomal protein L48, mitochondrial n=1 Tax=Latimeria chalumnae TaxID=7897 RepID=UPI0006D9246D|nr:PREDICTED: 39S ribosomal protein L48, mitochondrial [Latimeria chalumnae]|eukprot:XP_014349340.1 PREDICTED: 39S ribosomal protein L48, mitochondrial [Latimeria chalumnae]